MNEDDDWDKAIGQFRMALNTQIMTPLRLYGQDSYVDRALEEIINLSIQLHYRLEGVDEPYHVNTDRLHY